jgi:ribonuclease HI
MKNSKITICSDSKASLQALSSYTITSSLVLQCWLALQNLSQYNVVELFKVPGHSGVEGNEKADELARMGSDSQSCGPEPCLALPTMVAKSKIKDTISLSKLENNPRMQAIQTIVDSTIQENCFVLP